MCVDPLTLVGCAPTPLASYLKALAVLRLISSPDNHVSGEAADPDARGWWKNEHFHLRTTLRYDGLRRFFLEDYAPTPIMAPWNGRAGFFEGDTRKGALLIAKIEASTCRRFALMRRTIDLLRSNRTLSEYDRVRAAAKTADGAMKRQLEKKAKALKRILLSSIRDESQSQHVRYIDACWAIATEDIPAPLLGMGGVDGSRDFGVNFAKHLTALFEIHDGSATVRAECDIDDALMGFVFPTTEKDRMGQFSPGHGGPNATTSYQGSNPLNSWDVVLALEGTLLFAGTVARRWAASVSGTAGSSGRQRAAFPFTFEPTTAGAAVLSSEDSNRPRGEIWAPLWSKPTTYLEIDAVFSEGRLSVGSRTAQTGLDAARAVARLGATRGLTAFDRYSIVVPDRNLQGQATPLGRFRLPDRAPRRDLVDDLEAGGWLDQARRSANRKESPAQARRAIRRLDDALFLMTNANRAIEGTQEALMALAAFGRWLATSPDARRNCPPPPTLTADWVKGADDGSPEFRVAAALAAIGQSLTQREPDSMQNVLPMVAHFSPLDEDAFFRQGRNAWADRDYSPTVVWGAGPLVSNLIAVLERRLVEASIRGLEDKPLYAASFARLFDVDAFLSRRFDDARCSSLLGGLVWARPAWLISKSDTEHPYSVAFAYAALKPVLSPDSELHRIGALSDDAHIPVPPGLLSRLRRGGNNYDNRAITHALHLALERTAASGLPSPFGRTFIGTATRRNGFGVVADRLAAVLLVPVSTRTLVALINRVFPGILPEGPNTPAKEIKTHAA